MKYRAFRLLSVVLGGGLVGGLTLASASGPLKVSRNEGPLPLVLKTWEAGEALQAVKLSQLQEKDPQTGSLARWKGIRLSSLLDKTWGDLAPDQKASIDLLILKNAQGGQALIPRALAVKYPIMLASERNGGDISGWQSVLPWTTQPKIAKEGVPLEALFLSDVTEIELANYRLKFPIVFLRRRTDPSAMRGERIFVQSCMACHATGRGPAMKDISEQTRLDRLADEGHPQVKGGPALDDRDRRSLRNYLQEFRRASEPAREVASVQ